MQSEKNSSSDSEVHEEWQESPKNGIFLWNAEENINQDDRIAQEIISEDPTLSEGEEDSVLIEDNEDNNTNLYEGGDYILVSFPDKEEEHKFVCVIQELCSNHEFRVVAMKACNETRTSFELNKNDISSTKLTLVIEKLDFRNMSCAGDRLKYEFNEKLFVDG
ncbi:hypothetical protein JTB14_014676 [Gonioctena quinquepunctata]|nr:hypothetical protein JTB14_014676 [Gonioctena quinquepunctata]